MNYLIKPFNELTAPEFYQIAKLRVAVFVVEQQCPYQEIDDIDPDALHTWLAADDGTILGYTRLYAEAGTAHIGRVLTAPAARGTGVGHRLLEESITATQAAFPGLPIVIGAQAHLQAFYESHGFRQTSEVYLEDDIPHIEMVLKV